MLYITSLGLTFYTFDPSHSFLPPLARTCSSHQSVLDISEALTFLSYELYSSFRLNYY